MLTRTVRIARRKAAGRTQHSRLKHPAHTSREVNLVVRAIEITLPRPQGPSTKGLPPTLSLNLVQVVETAPPDGEVPIEWFLITPLPIATAAGGRMHRRCVSSSLGDRGAFQGHQDRLQIRVASARIPTRPAQRARHADSDRLEAPRVAHHRRGGSRRSGNRCARHRRVSGLAPNAPPDVEDIPF